MSVAKCPASMMEIMMETLPASLTNSQALDTIGGKDVAFGEQVQYENLSQEVLVREVGNLSITNKTTGSVNAVEADKGDCYDTESSNLPISIIESDVLPIFIETTDSVNVGEADKGDCYDTESSNLPMSNRSVDFSNAVQSEDIINSKGTDASLDALDEEKINYHNTEAGVLNIFNGTIFTLDVVETDNTPISDNIRLHSIPLKREEEDSYFTGDECPIYQPEPHPNFTNLLHGKDTDIEGELPSSQISLHHTVDLGIYDRTSCARIKRAVRMRTALSHSLQSPSQSYPLRTGMPLSLKQTTSTAEAATTRPSTGKTRATAATTTPTTAATTTTTTATATTTTTTTTTATRPGKTRATAAATTTTATPTTTAATTPTPTTAATTTTTTTTTTAAATTRPSTGKTRATAAATATGTPATTRSLNSTLNNAFGNAKERLERIDKLSVPIADKFIASPQPPKLSTSCPTLSVTEIETLQAEDLFSKLFEEKKDVINTAAKVKGKVKEKQNMVYLPLSANKLRVTVSADADDHWHQNHKSACKARTYYRHDICQGGSIQDLNPLIQPEELKKILFEKEGCCSDESSPQNLLRHFISSFRFDFICLVIDLQMQIIGTYDVSLGKYLPGLDIGFDYFNRKERENSFYSKRTNLIEIDFTKLPDNLFAIVPVFLDDSNVSRKELLEEFRIKSKLFQDVLFKLDFFCSASPLAREEIDHLSELYENNDVKKENEVGVIMIIIIYFSSFFLYFLSFYSLLF